MELLQYYAWYSNLLLLLFLSKRIRCDFLQLCKYYVWSKCEIMLWLWQWSNEMCFEHKIRLNVDHILKDIIILFLSCRLWFFMKHILLWLFKSCACIYFLLLHVVCTHLKCYTIVMSISLCVHNVKRNEWNN
jgi:glucan phosphoethanolaminetransferase (alkaline phosphatase superfamily)